MNDLLLPAVQKSSAQDLDPYYNLVSLHLKGDVNTGRNYNAFSDASSNNFRLTNNGDVRGSSFSPFNTSWSNYFDGTDDRLSVPDNAKIELGSSNFTIECFAFNTAWDVTQNQLFEKGAFASGKSYRGWMTASAIVLEVNVSGSATGAYTSFSVATTNNLNQWYHVAFVRSGTSVYIFRDGVQIGATGTLSGTAFDTSQALAIGGAADGNNNIMMNGYISNFRIITGQAVATSTFTPPTSLLTTSTTGWIVGGSAVALTGAVGLLTCQSNRFLDASANPLNITVGGGTPTVSSFSPFLDTDTVTGSGYFDGSGDYLNNSTLNATFTGEFTFEGWVFVNTYTNPTVFFGIGSETTNRMMFGITNSGQLFANYFGQAGNFLFGSAGSVTLNTWHHVAFVRSSSNINAYLNGVAQGTAASYSATVGNSGGVGIGANHNGSYPLTGYMSNVRYTAQALYTSTFTPPTAPLTAVANTQLLTLQERGAYNTIGFQDESEYQHVITRPSGANVAQGTFSPFSQTGWGNYFYDDRISVPAGSAFAYGTGAFTVEFWVYPNSLTSTGSNNPQVVTQAASGQNYFVCGFNTNGSVSFIGSNAGITGTAGDVVANRWQHIAYVRESTSTNGFKIYVDGVVKATGTSTTDFSNTSYNPTIGNYTHGSVGGLDGYVSNARITKGRAVYTGAFTPPIEPLTRTSGGTNPPQGTECSWLTCQSNRFLDSNGPNTPASSPLTITVTNDPRVVAFSPFKPVAYDPAVHGGSGYFDGTGDYLSTTPSSSAFSFGTGDFTIEYWVYINSGTNNGIFQLSDTAGGLKPSQANSLAMNIFTNNAVSIYANGTSYQAPNNTLPYNSWTHFAIVRSSNVTKLYANGSLITSIGSSGSITDNTNYTGLYVAVGGYYSTSYLMTGYVSNFRVVKGTAVYTSNFTPPSGPLPILPNTSLLLNFTNGGVIDSTGKNVIETFGNAGVVTTTIKKYGSGSMFFDGTGDYDVIPLNKQMDFSSSGSITIEFWMYGENTSRAFVIGSNAFNDQTSNYSAGIRVDWTPGSSCLIGAGTIALNLGAGVTANTWHHIAFCYNGPTTTNYVFLNGNLITSSVSSNAMTQTAALLLGVQGSNRILPYKGYIDDLRITSGLARYTANFTPPTKAHPDRGTASTLTTDMAAPSSVEALVVAGGASGTQSGNGGSPGGGAGGYIEPPSFAVSAGTSYNITIGAGGAGAAPAAGNFTSNDGNQTLFGSLTAIGGGGSNNNGSGAVLGGRNGGSGGGAVTSGSGSAGSGTQPSQLGDSGTYGFGNNGAKPTAGDRGGGGGGAGGAAPNGTTCDGGSGKSSSISGKSTFYAGGGGGGAYGAGTTAGTGGSAIGGDGVANGSATAASGGSGSKNGVMNTGSGGGGSWNNSGGCGSGGSGVVILAYPTTFRPLKASLGLVYTIDTVTRAGYRVYRFTAGTGTISW